MTPAKKIVKKKSVVTSVQPRDIRTDKDSFFEGDEHDETSEEFKAKMGSGERDEDVYTAEGAEELLEDDEIDAKEEGFSEGALPKKRRR